MRVLIFLLGVGTGWAQGQPIIRIVEIEHAGSRLMITVESLAGETLAYTLQRSPNLSPGSWLDQNHAILSVLNPSRVILTLPLDDESAGYIRVVASSASSPVAVVINEVMSNNETTVADGDGDFPDWIELYNAGDTAAELTGYHLSDNDANLSKWVFPAETILDPGQYLVVFASGKAGAEIPEGETHADFKLSNGNEPVILSDPLLNIVDRLDPGPLVSDNSVGHALDDLETYYVFDSDEPSPGAPNHDFIADPPEPFVQAPIFSIRGGVFDESVTLELIPPREEDLIRYTMDGSEPFRGSTPYSGPIELTETTVIRAVVLGA
ncbi:MAG: lamin tail domain-containing protein, partial [Verrucomicrobiota bacterium]|nr:lamin tail domain-containing protein [Verrucomicrobiota bacterium]